MWPSCVKHSLKYFWKWGKQDPGMWELLGMQLAYWKSSLASPAPSSIPLLGKVLLKGRHLWYTQALILWQTLFNFLSNEPCSGAEYRFAKGTNRKSGSRTVEVYCNSEHHWQDGPSGITWRSKESPKSCTWGGITPCTSMGSVSSGWKADLQERTWRSWWTSWTWACKMANSGLTSTRETSTPWSKSSKDTLKWLKMMWHSMPWSSWGVKGMGWTWGSWRSLPT